MLRLSAGVLLNLLSDAKRKPSNKRVFFNGEQYTLSDSSFLFCLLRMMNPGHRIRNSETLRVTVSRFKNCHSSCCADIPMNDIAYAQRFHLRVSDEPKTVLSEMAAFVHAFLTSDETELSCLGALLLALLDADQSIPQDTPVYPISSASQASPASVRLTKRELLLRDTVSLPALLTGLLDIVCLSVLDNTVGRATVLALDAWRQKEGSRDPAFDAAVDRMLREKRFRLAGDDLELDQEPAQASAQEPVPEPIQGQPSACQAAEASAPGIIHSTAVFPQNAYGAMFSPGVQFQNLPYLGQQNTGVSLFEMQSLRRDYYSLIVLDSDALTDQAFTLSYSCLFTEGTEPSDRLWLQRLEPAAKDLLLSIPTILATRNTAYALADPWQMAVLGRVRNIRVQSYGLRVDWKGYCALPQQLLNGHCEVLGIYRSNLSNELDVEHWAVKRLGLLEGLRSVGVETVLGVG